MKRGRQMHRVSLFHSLLAINFRRNASVKNRASRCQVARHRAPPTPVPSRRCTTCFHAVTLPSTINMYAFLHSVIYLKRCVSCAAPDRAICAPNEGTLSVRSAGDARSSWPAAAGRAPSRHSRCPLCYFWPVYVRRGVPRGRFYVRGAWETGSTFCGSKILCFSFYGTSGSCLNYLLIHLQILSR